MKDKKAVFQQIILDFFDNPLQNVLSRDIKIPTDIPKIISLLGPRRAGKTYVMYDLIQQLRKEVPKERIVYINLEDDRLFPLELSDLDEFLTGYYELFPFHKDQIVWFFFDEIQEVPNWEKFIRRLFDQETCRIYLTGSSSKLLSRELASVLRGRSIPFEIFPLSFSEFLRFQNIEFEPRSSKGQALLFHYLPMYMKQGGYPELIFVPKEFHNKVINEYLDLMLYRDLTERFSVKQPQLMKYLLKYLLANIANPLSIQKVFRDIKSQGYQVGKNTIYNYVSHLEEAFIIFRVSRFSTSIRKQAINPIKIYTVDSALKYTMSIQQDLGSMFENQVFLTLRRRGIQPFYFLENQELDFYFDKQGLYNACYSLSDPSTREREIKGCFEAMEYFQLNYAEIITWNERDSITQNNKTITIRPLWELLFSNNIP